VQAELCQVKNLAFCPEKSASVSREQSMTEVPIFPVGPSV
jgi:hypothetical protein